MASYHSYETEVSILGLFLNNSKISKEAVGRLEIDDFDNEENKIIFKNIKDLYNENKSIDIVHLLSVMNNNGDISKISDKTYLTKLLELAGLESLIDNYIKILKDKNKFRQLKNFLINQRQYLDQTSSKVEDVIENFEEEIFKVTRESMPTKEIEISSAVDTYIDKLKNFSSDHEVGAIYTEFKEFDNITNGFRPGDLIIVAARPSMGKTAFSLDIATNVAYKKHVYYFSLEMPIEQITQRIISSRAFIDSRNLKDPKNIQARDWAKLQEVKPILDKLNLVIDDTPGIKLSELVWKIRNYVMTNKLDLVIIDYLQLITLSNNANNRQLEVSQISRTLKILAREINVPIIVLAQLNRSVEKREDKRPLMSDIRESGAIEQDADIISFLYRPGYYDKNKNTSTQPVEIIVSKNRNGATGTATVNLHMSSGKFTGYSGS